MPQEVANFCSEGKAVAEKKWAETIKRQKDLIDKNKIHLTPSSFVDSLSELSSYVGTVSDLFSVESIGIARCVIYLMGFKLNIHLTKGSDVRSSKRCLELLKNRKDFSCLEIDLLPEKSFDVALRGGRLPHEGRFEVPAEKSPSFVVSKILMKDGLNISRSQFERIFVHFLGNTMIMKKLEDAIEYEKKCVDRKIYCSRIVTIDGYNVNLVKHSIPTFEAMHRKNRSVEVYPQALNKLLERYLNVVHPQIENFFRIKKELDLLMEKERTQSKDLKALQSELRDLQESRLNVLKAMKEVWEAENKE